MQLDKRVTFPERLTPLCNTTQLWLRLHRQVYWLSSGSKDTARIASLLHKPVSLINDIIETLLTRGVIVVREERKVLVIRPLLLKESFDLVTKVDFAHKFYENLFATYPTTMELFAKTDMRRQENSLMATLAVVIEGVTRGENLTPVIHALGAKHAHKGALAEHYPLVGAILLQTFAEVLGKRFTEQMQEAWEEAYEIISTEMINGARKEGETTVQAG